MIWFTVVIHFNKSFRFCIYLISSGGGPELDDISSADEDDEYDEDLDNEVVSAQPICDDPDCDHTPEKPNCKNKLQQNLNSTYNRILHKRTSKTTQSSRKNLKTLFGSGSIARRILTSVIPRPSVFPSQHTHQGRKKSRKRKNEAPTLSLFHKRVKSSIESCCCLPIRNFLGKWRFTRDFEWYSTAKYDNRLLSIGNKVI